MITSHSIHFRDAKRMADVPSSSIHLVTTSPPYPMVEMWDDIFSAADPRIRSALDSGDGVLASELMNLLLDRVWTEVERVLVPGGIVCINVGDATRKLGDSFHLYANHARITNAFLGLGLHALPHILWRKQTNKPNKFLGSGMLPPNAYVTLEHEFILVFRKGGLRKFTETERQKRQKSAYFWEERNCWYSDVWTDLKGVAQDLHENESRERSAAFPFELPYRLVSMFSIQGDTVLDPFLGTGTTTLAAMHTGRNSVGYEQDDGFREMIGVRIGGLAETSGEMVRARIARHKEFVAERERKKGGLKHTSARYGFPVMTVQERDMVIPAVREIVFDEDAGEYRVECGGAENCTL